MKLFGFTLYEKNGEYEYHYDKLIWARDIENAHKRTQQYSLEFYGDENAKIDEAEDCWHNFGEIVTWIHGLKEENLDEWYERMRQKALI